MGGGFGGKESKAAMVATPAAFVASKLNRPIRIMLDRDEDMLLTGGRHPFYMKYKTAFDDDGKILGCEIFIYNNAGYSFDLSFAVSRRDSTQCVCCKDENLKRNTASRIDRRLSWVGFEPKSVIKFINMQS